MNGKHLIVAAVMMAMSFLALAAPDSVAAPTPTQSLPGAVKPPVPKPQLKSVPDKKPQAGKTRDLKSKKKKECSGTQYCE